MYDRVLYLNLAVDCVTIGFVLIVRAKTNLILVNKTNECLRLKNVWMITYNFVLALEKTKATIIRSRQRREYVSFLLERQKIFSTKSLKHFGVIIDKKPTFGKHNETVSKKTEKKMAILTWLLSNVDEPRRAKKYSIMYCMQLLYGTQLLKQKNTSIS